MKNSSFTSLLLVISFHFTVIHSHAQPDRIPKHDIDIRKIPKTTLPVKAAIFESNETKNARTEYMKVAKSGQVSNSAIINLKNKGYSNKTILATVRQIRFQSLTFFTVDNTEVAEDAQLMLKAIPSMTAAEMINAIRDLYDVPTIKLFDIALLISQDSTVTISTPKSFAYQCDCKKTSTSSAAANLPVRKTVTKYITAYNYKKKLYPWECFNYWNDGFRAVILPETSLNEFLKLMRMSSYPFYAGISATDLSDLSVDFKIVMGTTAEALEELMVAATLAYMSPQALYCQMESPNQTSTSLSNETYYMGTCRHASILKTKFYLQDVLSALKRNGFSITAMATAAKTRFNPPDDDMKQRILTSFSTAVFSTAEILQASNILNN